MGQLTRLEMFYVVNTIEEVKDCLQQFLRKRNQKNPFRSRLQSDFVIQSTPITLEGYPHLFGSQTIIFFPIEPPKRKKVKYNEQPTHFSFPELKTEIIKRQTHQICNQLKGTVQSTMRQRYNRVLTHLAHSTHIILQLQSTQTMAFLLDMKKLRTIEKDFVLKPNPYVTDEKSNSVIWKLAVGELLAISAFACFTLTFLKVKPSITSANSFRNFTYFQAVTAMGGFFYHLYELQQLGKTIPEVQLQQKMRTYDLRYK